MGEQISSKTLAEVFSLSQGAMLKLAEMLTAEARKKDDQERRNAERRAEGRLTAWKRKSV